MVYQWRYLYICIIGRGLSEIKELAPIRGLPLWVLLPCKILGYLVYLHFQLSSTMKWQGVSVGLAGGDGYGWRPW